MPPRVVELPALHLVGARRLFALPEIKEIPSLWGQFIPRLGEIQGRKGMVTYGTCITATDAGGKPVLEYSAAVEVEKPGRAPDGLVAFTLAPGFYAVFTHEGHIRDIGKTWDSIWHTRMKEAGLAHRPAHDFERYDDRWNPGTGEGPVDIYIAIERARS